MPYRRTIRQRILRGGLSILASRQLKIPRWAYEAIYPRHKRAAVPDGAWMRRLVYTTGGRSEIGVVEGENAIECLMTLVGKKPGPADCEVGTIRRDLGVHAVENIDGFDFHARVMHRAENEEEAAHDLPIVLKLLRKRQRDRLLGT